MQFDRVSPARALAFAVVRATFEDGAFTERVFRAEADRLDLAGRERAQAQRLAYGAVQRRGTADVAIERLAGRSTRLLDPPVLAALRLRLYELLFAAAPPRPSWRRCASASTSCSSPTPRPTTPPSTRRSSWSRAPAPPTPPASSTRSCAGRGGSVSS